MTKLLPENVEVKDGEYAKTHAKEFTMKAVLVVFRSYTCNEIRDKWHIHTGHTVNFTECFGHHIRPCYFQAKQKLS